MKTPLFLSVAFLIAILSLADTINVPADQSTIAQALEAAQPGDIIQVAAGEYEESLELPSGITLRGAGLESTVIYHKTQRVCTLTAATNVTLESLKIEARYIEGKKDASIWVGKGSSLEMRTCHITGATLSGMECRDEGTSVLIQDCHFQDNQSTGLYVHEGAIANVRRSIFSNSKELHGASVSGVGSNLEVEDCHFQDNQSTGLYVDKGANAKVRRSIFSNSKELHGASVSGVGSNLEVEDCHFQDNQQAGLSVHEGANATIRQSIFSNSTTLHGAAVSGVGSNLEVENCRFQDNQSTGLYVYEGANANVRQSIFSNSRTLHGASVSGAGSTLSVTDSTFALNKQNGLFTISGGLATLSRSIITQNGYHGIELNDVDSKVKASNCILWSNRQTGIWVYNDSSLLIRDSIIGENGFWGFSNQGIQGTGPAASYEAKNNLYWKNGRGDYETGAPNKTEIVNQNPLFIDSTNGDFRLKSNSPALGKGTNGDNIGLFPMVRTPSSLAWLPLWENTKGGGASSAIQAEYELPSYRKLAFVIGVKDYRDAQIRDLRYTRQDAKEIASLLQKMNYDVTLLTDKTKPAATEEEISVILQEIAHAEPRDQIVFYFSGHGSDQSNPLGEGRGFLLPLDAKANRIPSTCIPLENVRKSVENSEADRIAVVLDSCFSAGGKSIVGRGKSRKSAGDRDITGGLTWGSGQIALYSSRDNEASLESSQYNNGYFTHFLIEAWEAGHRDVDDIYSYVFEKVKEATKDAQHPRRDYRETDGSVSLF